MSRSLVTSFIAAFALLCVAHSPARAQTFSNTTPLNAPNGSTTASVYPSVINVPSGAVPGNTVARIAVTIRGINHVWSSDIQAVLVSPGGQAIALLYSNFGSGDAVNTTATFYAEASTSVENVSGNFVTGIYRPTTVNAFSAPPPAPPGPYFGTLSSLTGTPANGNWQLYVADSFPTFDPLSITDGWSIEFIPAPIPQSNAFTYQGKLETAAATSTANFRFSVWEDPVTSAAIYRVGNVSVADALAVQNGRFTASVDVGRELKSDRSLWLQIEVESPPGSGYVTLSPRQPVTPIPQARLAQQAVNAPWSGLTGQPAITTAVIGSGWQMLFNNTSTAAFHGGMRLSDNGFFEVTNNANLSSPNFARLASTGAWSAVSDERLKTDVTPTEGNLDAALKLRPVNFRWKADGTTDFGLIAQDVRAVLPRLVTGNETTDFLTINYSQLSVVAIGAIQEQQAQRSADRAMIDRLARENADLRARLERLEKALEPKNTPKLPVPNPAL